MGNKGTRNKRPVPKRAVRKKLQKSFKAGDVVTWGEGVLAHRVLEVEDNAVIVDASSEGFPRYRVEFGDETLTHTTAEPDVLFPPGGAFGKKHG